MSLLLKLIAGLVLLALVAALATSYLQRWLMYFPDPRRVTPDSAGLAGVVEVEFPASDGLTGLAWYATAKAGQPTILYFHGNAGSLETRTERIRKYMARGFGMFMMTYRGFGGRAGEPSERANVTDAIKAYEALVARGVSPVDIVLYGESLGSGVAVQVAAAKAVGGVVLDAPYTSMVDLAEMHYPYLPSRYVMTERYDTRSRIVSVTAPLLIVHGESDDIIPVGMGREVFRLANEPKRIVTFPGAGHSDHYMFGSYEAIFAWLDGRRAGKLGKASTIVHTLPVAAQGG